jgi:NAD(P)-dependent dehydrogenase (short-subunit alcohol dehydrogenase family)
MRRLDGRVCVVNGAASVLGLAVAHRSALETDLDTWRRVQDANLTTVFLSCKHGVRHLRQTEPAGGSVINAASVLADIGAATTPIAVPEVPVTVNQDLKAFFS